MALDHIVINTLRDMDDAARIFAGLGFKVTPRGHHSLGSINHLMVDPAAYLELVGVPAEGRQRREVLDSPLGLNGLVLRTDDADATFSRLEAAGLAPSEPVAFSRPVDLGDGDIREARFRTVRFGADTFPAGRVYVCQHLTPELVWRDAWMAHPNGYRGLADIEIDSPDPDRDVPRYAALLGGAEPATEGAETVLADGDFRLRVRPADRAAFAAATLLFEDLDRIAKRAAAVDGADWRPGEVGTGTLTVPALDLTLHCRSVTR